jgi:hypothetical protein
LITLLTADRISDPVAFVSSSSNSGEITVSSDIVLFVSTTTLTISSFSSLWSSSNISVDSTNGIGIPKTRQIVIGY